MDYLRVIRKRKWWVIFGTLFLIILAGALSLAVKPVYEIDAIVQPGKFFIEDQNGNLEEVVVEDPQQIAHKVNLSSYNALIAVELNIDEKGMPEITAERIRDTLLVRMWIKNHDIDLSKKMLSSLINFLKVDIDKKIDIEINNIDSLITGDKIEKLRHEQEIEILKKKLGIIEQRKRDIVAEMKSNKEKVRELEKEQIKILQKEDKGEIESLGLLLYSNEIQQSFRYYDILNEKLSREKLAEENVNSYIQEESALITNLDNKIANLTERKGRIDYTKVIKTPTSSINPVFPNMKLNLLIGFILGLMLSGFFIFILDYVESKQAEKL